jgi:hypothetical protein
LCRKGFSDPRCLFGVQPFFGKCFYNANVCRRREEKGEKGEKGGRTEKGGGTRLEGERRWEEKRRLGKDEGGKRRRMEENGGEWRRMEEGGRIRAEKEGSGGREDKGGRILEEKEAGRAEGRRIELSRNVIKSRGEDHPTFEHKKSKVLESHGT